LSLFEWIQAPRNLEAYQAWRNNPVTEAVLDGLAALNGATLVHPTMQDGKVDPLQAVQLNGFQAGRAADIDLLCGLDAYHQPTSGDRVVRSAIESYLVETEHFSLEQARKLIDQDEEGLSDGGE